MALTCTATSVARLLRPGGCWWPGLLRDDAALWGADTGRCGTGPGLCEGGGSAAREFVGLPAGTRLSSRSSSVLALAPAHGGVVAATSTSQVSRSLWMDSSDATAGERRASSDGRRFSFLETSGSAHCGVPMSREGTTAGDER